MKKIMALILFLWIGFIYAQADDEVEIPVWEVVQRCVELNYPTIPQSRWDFEGTIMSHNANGVHAIRTDDVNYYIALRSEHSFTRAGMFSPDRQWFAYFLGYPGENDIFRGRPHGFYYTTHLRVISVHPRAEKYDYRWNWLAYFGYKDEFTGFSVYWLDNESFVTNGYPQFPAQFGLEPLVPNEHPHPFVVVDFKSREITTAAEDWGEPLEIHNQDTSSVRVKFPILEWNSNITLDYLSISADGRYGLSNYGYNFEYDRYYRGIYPYYMVDLDNQQVMDFCLWNKRISQMIWSPDGETIAFLYDNDLVLLDVGTWQTQVLDYQTSQLIDWIDDQSLDD